MFFKQLKRDTLSEGRSNKKRKVDAAEEVAVDDDLAVTPIDICSSALFVRIGDSVLLPSGKFHFRCCITSQNSSVWLFAWLTCTNSLRAPCSLIYLVYNKPVDSVLQTLQLVNQILGWHHFDFCCVLVFFHSEKGNYMVLAVQWFGVHILIENNFCLQWIYIMHLWISPL